jgi:hypothetical protein
MLFVCQKTKTTLQTRALVIFRDTRAFPWQKSLSESALLLRYTYTSIAFLVEYFVWKLKIIDHVQDDNRAEGYN